MTLVNYSVLSIGGVSSRRLEDSLTEGLVGLVDRPGDSEGLVGLVDRPGDSEGLVGLVVGLVAESRGTTERCEVC